MKKILFYSFLLFLFVPLLRQINVLPLKDIELDGNTTMPTLSELNWHNWINGVYQKKAEAVATENIGYRGAATRLRNQIDYSLFNLAHSDKAVIGKHNILFDEWYLDAWTGRTFIGKDFIDIKLHKLKMVQDTLEKLGTDLIFVLAPNKADFFEEDIPEYYRQKRFPKNNYSYLAKRSEELKLDFIDLNKYFLSIKETSNFPLYPKSGIHWSEYGSYIALDTLLNYIEAKKNIDLNDISFDNIEITDTPTEADYDIGKNINLLFEIPQWEMAYPKLRFEDSPDKQKLKMLVSADSYYFNIYNYKFTEHLFANNAFWYYAHWVYPEMYSKTTESTNLDLRKEIEDKDIVLMMVTSRFMHNIDWLLIEKLFGFYYPDILWKKNYDRRNLIHIDHDYFFRLVGEAERHGLTTNEKLNKDIEYMFSLDNSAPKGKSVFDFVYEIMKNKEGLEPIVQKAKINNIALRDQEINEGLFLFKAYIAELIIKENEIRDDSLWFENVAKKANEKGVSIEDQLRDEAIFIMDGKAKVNDGAVDEPLKVQDPIKKDIKNLINEIRANKEWMAEIEEKALKNEISIEEQINLDAKWMLDNEN